MGSWVRARPISSALSQPAGRSGPRGNSAEAVTAHVYPVAAPLDDAARAPARMCPAPLSGIVVTSAALYLAVTEHWRTDMATTELTGNTIGQTIKDNEIVLVD